jgi:hypothetical protein
VVLEDRKTFAQIVHKHAMERPEVTFTGHTAIIKTNGILRFKISLVTGLPKQLAIPTLVHEYAHTWLALNGRPKRLSADAKEGFCELLFYKYAEEKGDSYYVQRCLHNTYTRGQIDAFIAAEKAYGLARIIQWIREGEGDHIELKNLAQIIVKPPPAAVPRPPPSVAVVDRPLFDGIPVFPRPKYTDLVLKGISGNASRRLAMINDVTFASNERGKVRIAESNLTLHCLEIHQNSVVVQLQGEATSRTLSLNNIAAH